jgi:hypothetical protein
LAHRLLVQINGKWSHDLFQNGGAQAVLAVGGVTATGGSTKLIISNLDFGDNDSDIEVKELLFFFNVKFN